MKETVEHNNRFYGEELKTESEQLKEWLVVANKEIERLNNIIDKAIKYIKENTSDGYIIVDDLNYYDIPELLRILQGSDKE